MINRNFHWDEHNLKHCIDDHPDRKNTSDEIESAFIDPIRLEYYDRIGKYGNDEYICIGKSNMNRILYIAYEIRDLNIRPFTCIPNNKKIKQVYENEAKKSNS